MTRYMRWCRFMRGEVRHLTPSDKAERTLCGLDLLGSSIAIRWDRDETQPKLPVCQTCISVATQAGEMLAEAVRESGIKA